MGLTSGITVRVPEDVRARIQRLAERSGLQPADLMRAALTDFLERAEGAGELRIALTSRVAEDAPAYPSKKKGPKRP